MSEFDDILRRRYAAYLLKIAQAELKPVEAAPKNGDWFVLIGIDGEPYMTVYRYRSNDWSCRNLYGSRASIKDLNPALGWIAPDEFTRLVKLSFLGDINETR